MTLTDIHETVQKAYAEIAVSQNASKSTTQSSSCCTPKISCCDPADLALPQGEKPVGDLGLSCGDPVAFDFIEPGHVVLDLGSGAGRDVFLAAEKVGPTGKVFGVDMTDDMLTLAEQNRSRLGLENVSFVKGFIEALPLETNTVDIVISNCVINLSPDKAAVFKEINRVLKPGGRMVISDTVLNHHLPDALKTQQDLYCACLSAALLKADYLEAIQSAGLQNIEILTEKPYLSIQLDGIDLPQGLSSSITVTAQKIL